MNIPNEIYFVVMVGVGSFVIVWTDFYIRSFFTKGE